MQKPARTLLGALTATLVVVGTAVAGPDDDPIAAYQRGDYASAIRSFRALAERGDALGQTGLGLMYREGRGVPQSYTEAVKWYRLAADQGYVIAQSTLGIMYDTGYGLPQDYAEAVKWYRLAADQGNLIAQYNLGHMYAEGRGVQQDYVQAHMWFNLSSANPASRKEIRDKAVYDRNFVAAKMSPAQIAEAQKLASEWKPTSR
jgi:TPR repeat protein